MIYPKDILEMINIKSYTFFISEINEILKIKMKKIIREENQKLFKRNKFKSI